MILQPCDHFLDYTNDSNEIIIDCLSPVTTKRHDYHEEKRSLYQTNPVVSKSAHWSMGFQGHCPRRPGGREGGSEEGMTQERQK